MRTAYLLIGIGALVIGVGGWFLASSNTVTVRNPQETPLDTVHKTTDMSPDPLRETQGASIGGENEIQFTCAGGKSMTAIFTRDILALTLSDGRQITLREAESGSGIRYVNSNASIELRGKGKDAFLQEGGVTTYTSCASN